MQFESDGAAVAQELARLKVCERQPRPAHLASDGALYQCEYDGQRVIVEIRVLGPGSLIELYPSGDGY